MATIQPSAPMKPELTQVVPTPATNSWATDIGSSLKTQLGTWLVAIVIAILGLFSSKITESIKFGLNRADLRVTQFETLAFAVSSYIFSAELITEFIEHGWTTEGAFGELVKEYNTSVTTLRNKEFVYRSWITKFWGKNEVAHFESFIGSVREFDSAIHSLNDELEKVIEKSQKKIDETRAKEVLKVMKPSLINMRKEGYDLILSTAQDK